MLRRFLVAISVLSLLLFVATVVLWARSRYRDDHLSWLDGEERFTLRSFNGRITLFVPPAGSGDPPTQEMLARHILDSGVEWTIRCADDGGSIRAYGGYITANGYDHYTRVASPPLTPVVRPLLHALENPETALPAHVALAVRYGRGDDLTIQPQPVRVGGKNAANFDGLQVILQPTRWFRPHALWIMYESTAEIVPTSLPGVRDQWHRRLDIPRWSLDYIWVAAIVGILPLVGVLRGLGAALQRQRRRVRSQCVSCGYDLRASPNRCPECGAPSRAAAAAGASPAPGD